MGWIDLEGLVKEYEGVTVVDDVSLSVEQGEFVVLLGPSGAGKSTLLHAIAGFVDPTAGTVMIRGKPVKGVPPWQRDIGMVFQGYALFPHMTVRDNVAFGMRMRGVPKRERLRRAVEFLELFGLAAHATKRPAQLSGGEQQRVALARALVYEPSVILLDEPLGALDRQLRLELRDEIRRVQQTLGITAVYVTHDQEEAFVLGDRVGIMRRGRLEQLAPPGELYRRPANEFVSTFLGSMNFLDGEVRARDAAGVQVSLLGLEHSVTVAGADCHAATGRVLVGIRPERVALWWNGQAVPAGPGPRVPGRIEAVSFRGEVVHYAVRLAPGVTIAVTTLQQPNLCSEGSDVTVGWADSDVLVLPTSARNEATP
jgi:putative spermidine/putrescine transport system ATP-binding protein